MKNVFYGVGNHFFVVFDKYKQILHDVMAFVDSDASKQGRVYFDKPCYAPGFLLTAEYDLVVITSDAYTEEIRQNLLQQGVCENKITYIDDYIGRKIADAELMPTHIGVDASTCCQLNCLACYMRIDAGGCLGSGHLSFENFKRLLDDNPSITKVELSNNGEIFLNPQLKQIIEYAYLKGVELYSNNGVNFNHVSDEVLEALVRCNFRSLTISLDGASAQTYAQYRVNGDFNAVINNIKKVNRYKYRYSKDYPNMKWQFVVRNNNQNEIPEAKWLANELNMEIVFKPTWESDFIPENPAYLLRETGMDFRRSEHIEHNDTAVYGNVLCRQLFLSPRINWDGRLIGCCAAWKKDFGVNVFDVGLENALRSENFVKAKKMLMGEEPAPEDISFIPCAECNYYKAMCRNGKWIKASDLMYMPFFW